MTLIEYKDGDLQERDEDNPQIICQLVNVNGKTFWVSA